MFVGRKEELEALAGLWGKRVSSLVTCRGRRRVGKSTLIEEFAARTADNFIVLEGLAPRKGMSDAKQRKEFCRQLAGQTGRIVPMAKTWAAAFKELDDAIPQNGRTVVLLDEISWIGGYDPDFPGYLKTAWDRLFKRHDRLVLVLCGSVAAWIADNILNSTGFVGRNSLDLEVPELRLEDAVKVLPVSADRLSSREKIDILSIAGCVPKYLEEFRPELTVDENVRRLCFRPHGILFREFDETFSDVFGRNATERRRVLEMLSEAPLSVAELAEKDGKIPNGHLSRTLKELELAGFVARESGLNPMTGACTRRERYRIKDNYVRFYLHFIKPKKQAIENGLFEFTSVEQLKGWEGILGFQFENLVLNHLGELLPRLGLGQTLVLSAAPYVQRGSVRSEGCQIDLLIQTGRTAIIVEIKRQRAISADIIEEVDCKRRRLRLSPHLSVRTALVYDGELSPLVRAEGFFDFIVPFAELLQP